MRMRPTYGRCRVVLCLLMLFLALVTPVAAARVVAIGDVHGNLDRFRVTLREAALIDTQDHWIGGSTILVQTGDTLDRGPNSRGISDLLMALEEQAHASGGQVIPLLGNHEVMNIIGDLRYTSAEEYASYADAKSEARREAAYKEYAKWFKRRYPSGEPKPQEQWLVQHPLGFIEQRESFAPKGKYGRWLRQHKAVAQVGDTIFVHGGINPATDPLSVKQLNEGVQTDLRAFDSGRDLLLKRDAVLPFFTSEEITVAAQEELGQARKELVTLQARRVPAIGSNPARLEVPIGDRNSEEGLQQDIRLLENFVALPSSLLGEQGPLWFRGFADWSDAEGEAALPQLLAAFQARRFVVGHTTQPDRIGSRWNGRVFLIDTSYTQPDVPGGRASALEIDGSQVTAIYQGERVPLQSAAPNATGAANVSHPPARSGYVWRDANGNALPFKNDEEVVDFLRTAEVVSDKRVSTGITGVRKLALEKNGVRANAVFRTVDEEKAKAEFSGGEKEMFFRDSYLFEPAAYELSRLLGLDNVPPAVLRTVRGTKGSVQMWVEGAMSEGARRKNKATSPDEQRWNKQTFTVALFDALIYNTDRNPGNLLITPDWKIWMIDHTRAFRRPTSLRDEKAITRCERTLYERLKALDETTAQQRLKDYLRPVEIKSLLKRRDEIVKRLDRLISQKGENAVLFTLTPLGTGE